MQRVNFYFHLMNTDSQKSFESIKILHTQFINDPSELHFLPLLKSLWLRSYANIRAKHRFLIWMSNFDSQGFQTDTHIDLFTFILRDTCFFLFPGCLSIYY